MNAPILNRFEIREATDAGTRDEVCRFRYRIYVERMGRRQKYADHRRKTVVEPLDETATIFAACINGVVVGTVRGNRFSDPGTDYYKRLYGIDHRFGFRPHDMSLSTKLMFEPSLQKSSYPIRLMLHHARCAYAAGCKIDFLDCNKHLIPFFGRFGYLDYHGWVVHREYGTVRPMCLPMDQIARFDALGSPLADVAREFCVNNQFGGCDLVETLSRAVAR